MDALRSDTIFSKRDVKVASRTFAVLFVAFIFVFDYGPFGLLTPVPPGFRAALLGIGVFFGIVAAVVERDKLVFEDGEPRRDLLNRGAGVGVMVAVLLVTVWCCDKASEPAWMWWTFKGGPSAKADATFTVTKVAQGNAGGSVYLREDADGLTARIRCHGVVCYEVTPGERLILSVETGDFGARRVSLPAARELRRATT